MLQHGDPWLWQPESDLNGTYATYQPLDEVSLFMDGSRMLYIKSLCGLCLVMQHHHERGAIQQEWQRLQKLQRDLSNERDLLSRVIATRAPATLRETL